MSAKSEQLFNELIQLYAQYKQEVPSQRQAWPESIKARIFELQEIGARIGDISAKTGISKQTIYGWNYEASKRRRFLPVNVVAPPLTVAPSPAATSEVVRRKTKISSTVTVITPDGFRIEGLRLNRVAAFLKAVAK